MPQFSYRCIDAQGLRQSGTLEGKTRDAVIAQLQAQGQVPISVHLIKANLWGRLNQEIDLFGGVSKRDVAEFTKQLAALLEAGLVLDRSLGVLANTAANKQMRKLIEELQVELRGGENFASALSRKARYFPTFYIAMVRAGETSGQLGPALNRLGVMLERSEKFRASVMGALIYPAILLALVTVTLIVVVTLVLPQFADVFENAGATLPLPTRITMVIGETMRHYWWLLLGLAILTGLAVHKMWRKKHIRLPVYRKLLHSAFIRSWILEGDAVRFSRTLGTLLRNGQAIGPAMQIASSGIVNDAFREDVQNGMHLVRQGQRLPKTLADLGYLPNVLVQLCYVGDETGNLGLMLQRAADVLEDRIEVRMQRFLAVFAPVITLILGGVVAGLIGSLIMGMMSVNTLVG